MNKNFNNATHCVIVGDYDNDSFVSFVGTEQECDKYVSYYEPILYNSSSIVPLNNANISIEAMALGYIKFHENN